MPRRPRPHDPHRPTREVSHAHQPTDDHPAPPPPEHIYCKRCGYDLSATHDLILCPECGRAFDPSNKSTFDTTPRQEIRKRLARRVLLIIALTALILSALYWSIIPRPISTLHPALWLWLDKPTGYQRHPNRGPAQLRILWLHGTPRSITIYDRTPGTPPDTPIAKITRTDERADHFELEVLGPDLPMATLIGAFNTLRHDHEVFGIQWTRDQPRTRSVAPFSVNGSMDEVMSAIIRHYGIRIQPLRQSPDDQTVYAFLPDGIGLPDDDDIRARNAARAAGLLGPPDPSHLPPVQRAFDQLQANLDAPHADTIAEPIKGRLIKMTIEQAEHLGYTVEQRTLPIYLQRYDWHAARSGWF
ncbi:MAG: hypothetical protein ACTS3F_11180 [Phycisphaerales bacterium]